MAARDILIALTLIACALAIADARELLDSRWVSTPATLSFTGGDTKQVNTLCPPLTDAVNCAATSPIAGVKATASRFIKSTGRAVVCECKFTSSKGAIASQEGFACKAQCKARS